MKEKFGLIVSWVSGLVMALAIIGGLLIIGGPGQARAEKQDNARLKAMSETAYAISCYSDNVGALPEDSAPIKTQVEKATSVITSSKKCKNLNWETDPVSDKEFEYIRVEDHEFQLCAVFARPSSDKGGYGKYRHVTGNYAFDSVLSGMDKPRPNAGRHCYTAKYWDTK